MAIHSHTECSALLFATVRIDNVIFRSERKSWLTYVKPASYPVALLIPIPEHSGLPTSEFRGRRLLYNLRIRHSPG